MRTGRIIAAHTKILSVLTEGFMIVEKIAGHLHDTDKGIDKVKIEWFERDKKRLRKVSEKGVEMGISVDTPLNDGDILYEDDKTVIVAEIAPCELIRVSVSEITEMGRLCFEIGNRHLSLSIKPDSVTVPYDEPTFEYLKKLGFNAVKVTDKFSDYTECKGHSHTHHHHEH